MASFSIIIPSYNQDKFIKETLLNLVELKKEASKRNIPVQLILVDNCSNKETILIIDDFKEDIDNLFIENDKGQYDAINKGLKVVAGDYWTWLNTDDLIDIEGFFKLTIAIEKDSSIDYIYGNIGYIDEASKFYKDSSSGDLDLGKLTNSDASISQPGSFFKTSFSKKIGELAPYHFAFDYEYILRCLKNKANIKRLETNLAYFRYYSNSKSGSKNYKFLEEQMTISKLYGRQLFSKLSFMLSIRIIKRKLFNA